jgi:hypothetical protein
MHPEAAALAPRAQMFRSRRTALRQAVGSGLIVIPGQEAMWRNPDNPFPFRQNSHLLYLAPAQRPGCALVMDVDEELDILFGPAEEPDHLLLLRQVGREVDGHDQRDERPEALPVEVRNASLEPEHQGDQVRDDCHDDVQNGQGNITAEVGHDPVGDRDPRKVVALRGPDSAPSPDEPHGTPC